MFFGSKVTEIAIGQIRGFVQPSKAERLAAFELFVELSVRVTAPSVDDNRGLLRDELDHLAAIGDVTREILRKHGCEAAKGRNDGNITLAVVALRVVNEIIKPRLILWEPELRDHEARRAAADPPQQPYEWEQNWARLALAVDDLDAMRREIRGYMDTLAAIAGTPSLTDLVVPIPPSAPIEPVHVPSISDAARALGQPREKMVRWFSPWEALGTFRANRGRHPDRPGARDRPDRPLCTPIAVEAGEGGETWIDYVSDLGDGFDPTMAVAFQLTRPSLTLPIDRTGELPDPPARLPRGRLLVMGGDQVYPHSSPEGYRRQTILPYRIAAEAHAPTGAPPSVHHDDLVAIPGNHDWYGGPEHFEEVFVDADVFAGHYRLRQTERWWAVQLPHGWWMWGIDTALDNTLNDDQMAYFRQAAEQLQEGDRVIVCSPVPLWQLRQKRQEEYFTLRSFLRTEIVQRGAHTPLFVSGDSHFFAHYWRVDGVTDEHHITAGGGGAFMQPTHNLPEQVPYEKGAPEFKLGARWPRPVESRSLGANLGNVKDPQFRSLFAIIALVHAAFAGLVSVRAGALAHIHGPIDSAGNAARWVVAAWPGWPILALMLIAMMFATAPNSRESQLVKGSKKYGLLHGAVQAALFVAVAAFARLVGPDAWWWRFVVVPLLGGVLSTVAFVLAVRWINRSIKANDTLAFSSAHLTRYKHFVRMRIDTEGDLQVFVIGLDPVGSGWYDAMDSGALVPPYDEQAGTPKLHYVWGRTFTRATETEVLERARTLGLRHPSTLAAMADLGRRRFAAHVRDGDPAALTDAVDWLTQAVEETAAARGDTDLTTLSYGWSLAEALIARGGADAAQGRAGLRHCAVGHLAHDLASGAPDLRPVTIDAVSTTAVELVFNGEANAAEEFLRGIEADLAASPVLAGSVGHASVLEELAMAQLRREYGGPWEARPTIDHAVALLTEHLGPDHERTLQAMARQAQVRVAEINRRGGAHEGGTLTPAARIEELAGILNGVLSSFPDTHPAAVELRMALAQVQEDDGFLPGARSWLQINAQLLADATVPLQVLGRLTNGERLARVLQAEGDYRGAAEVQLQVAADTETLHGVEWRSRFAHLDAAATLGVLDPRLAVDHLRPVLPRFDESTAASVEDRVAVRIGLAEYLTKAGCAAEALELLRAVRPNELPSDADYVRTGFRHVQVETLNALDRPAEALQFLRAEWSAAEPHGDEPSLAELELAGELAEQLLRCDEAGIVALLEPRIAAIISKFRAEGDLATRAHQLLASALVDAGRPTDALELLDRFLALPTDPATPFALPRQQHVEWALLRAAMAAGEDERAITLVQEMLARGGFDPGDTTHRMLCRNLATLTPAGTPAAVAAAEAYVAAAQRSGGDTQDAHDLLAIALEQAPDVPDHLARALAERELILAAELAAAEPRPWAVSLSRYHVARLSGSTGDHPRAMALLERNLDPNDELGRLEPDLRAECQRVLAHAYFESGRMDDAVRMIDEAVAGAAACHPRTHPARAYCEQTAATIHEAAARAPWEPAPVAPDA